MKKSDRDKNPSKNKNLKAPRASFHDYCAPGYYLITITAHKGTPPLSEVKLTDEDMIHKGSVIIPINTSLGEKVREELLSIPKKNPKLQIKRYVIMPDHIHFLLQVSSRLELPIGKYIAPFSVGCSRAYTNLFSLPVFTTLFLPFDDRIIFNYPQLDRAMQYIIDNPRRYIIRRRYPDLFHRHLNLEIGEHEYAAYGNMFLLKQPYLLPIRIHRRWSDGEFESYTKSCMEEISKGAIPISTAIHKVEKDIIKNAIADGSSAIILRDLGFNERFKPSGEYFELCAEGRLLLICPWPDNLKRRSDAGYSEFHKMNDFASNIASIPSDARLKIRIRKNS